MAGEYFIVEGGNRLDGTLQPQGAKNEALQILCAAVLTEEPVTVSNVPDIVDVRRLLTLIEGLGATVDQLNSNTYRIEADDIDLDYSSTEEYQEHARRIRGSVMLMGVMLARFGKAFIPKPGGDKIGRRRLDTHFHGFQKLGATVEQDRRRRTYFLSAKNMHGSYILMDEISVTGTANIIMSAVLTEGETTIYNAACEPYIQQLCKMLIRMGARIEGVGSNLLKIRGVDRLSGTEHRILPDMIEIGSFIGLAAMTRSKIRIQDAAVDQLGNILPTFRRLGITIRAEENDLLIPAQESYRIETFMDGSILTVYDAPWPGFSPDLLSIVLVTSTQATGSVLVHQKMFESRLFFTDKLIDMGAQIILCDPHRATVIGLGRKYPLRAIEMSSPDIRAGVSLLIAALSAEGTSTIYNINQIDRGYERIDQRLNAIGANIERRNGTN